MWLSTVAGRIEQAGDLLGAGAAGRDQTDRAGADDVGEAQGQAGAVSPSARSTVGATSMSWA